MTLSTYLSKHVRDKKGDEQHTHTAFSLGRVTKTLHIPNNSQLRAELYKHVSSAGTLATGPNSVTEKVKTGEKFRLFFDIDFQSSSVAAFLNLEGHTVADVTKKLTEIPICARNILNKLTGESPDMVLATRLPYKMHIHYPTVIVTSTEAKRISKLLQNEIRIHPFYEDTAIDVSVYSSGLRMLYCHKGAMTNPDKIKQEQQQHEKMYGKGSWSAVYEVTDETTWEKQEKSIEALELTSILVDDEATKLTSLNFDKDSETDGVITTPGVKQALRKKAKGKGEVNDQDDKAQISLGFLNRLLGMSDVIWTYEKGSEAKGKGHQVVTQCKMCLIDPNREHSEKGHSCVFINSKSVYINCFACGSGEVPTSTAKQIINQFNVIVLQTPSSEENTYQELRNDLLQGCAEQNLRRDMTGVVYKRVPGLSYAYVRYKTSKEYLNEIFMDDDRFSDNPNNIDKLDKYMKEYDSTKFPFLKPDRNYLGFDNGVLKIDTCEFTKSEDVPEDLIVRKHFAIRFVDKPTPLFDSILQYQDFDEHVIDMLKSSIGRLFFQVGEKDNWQYMPYLLGEAGTGKSTVMNVVKRMFSNLGAVGKTEDKYLLGGLYDKDVVLIDDVPRNIKNAFDQQTWQSCISGGPVQIRLMNQVGFTVDSWLVPMFWGGNWNVDYDDKGQVSRRMLIWNFEKVLRGGTGKATLEEDILKDELPAIILHCLRSYQEKVQQHRRQLVYDWCPEYFKKTQEDLREERNPLYRFLKRHAEYSEGAKILMEDVKIAFSRKMDKTVSKNLDRGTFLQVDERWDFGRADVCKSCKKLAGRGCCEQYKRTERGKDVVVLNLQLT